MLQYVWCQWRKTFAAVRKVTATPFHVLKYPHTTHSRAGTILAVQYYCSTVYTHTKFDLIDGQFTV